MAEIFPNLARDINVNIQEAERLADKKKKNHAKTHHN